MGSNNATHDFKLIRMQQNSIPKSEINARCKSAFASYGMSENVIANHLTRMRKLHLFMEEKGYDAYTRQVGDEFCRYLREECNLTYNYRKTHTDYITLVNLVVDGLPYGARFKKRSDYTQPDTAFGHLADSFIETMKSQRYSDVSIGQYKLHLKRFSLSMQMSGIEPASLARHHVLDFMSVTNVAYVRRLSILRHFLRYLYEQREIASDLSTVLKGCQPPAKEKVISYYTPEEIQLVENSINRANATGKRDYAMVLLASRLGLRSSDIRRLQLKDLDWDKSIISLKQYKTGKPIELPILSDVGDAIIDYLLHGRPKTTLGNVFVTANHPYKEIGDSAFTGVLLRIFRESRVNVNGRHHGPHSLRHSLATSMLNQGTKLPVISEALGHTSTESTMFYLGVDVKSLLNCSLPVPEVPDSYYTQKGGYFYEG